MNAGIQCLAALDEETKCANVVIEAPKGSSATNSTEESPLYNGAGLPADPAPAFVFFASETDSSSVTGQVVHVKVSGRGN